jgi:hypothetical protein
VAQAGNKNLSAADAVSLRQRAEALVGRDKVKSWLSANIRPPKHRLGLLLKRLNDFANGTLTPLEEDVALLSAAEVDSVLSLAEEWKDSSAWSEVRRGLRDSGEYLHAVGTLAVGSMLRVRHPSTQLVVATAGGRDPDVALEVAETESLSVEVKAPARLWQPASSLDAAESLHITRAALSAAGYKIGQLRAGVPGVLALAGLLIPQSTYDVLVRSFELHLTDEGAKWPHVLGLAIFNLRLTPGLEGGRVTISSEQQSVLRRNPHYQGRLWIESDWSGPWRLIKR